MQQIGKERVKLTFGEKLVQLRKQHRLSQEELAARLKVSRQAVSRWETGETMPETENVLGLSRLFQVSTDYLLKEELEEGPGQEEAISRAAQQTAAGQGAAWKADLGNRFDGAGNRGASGHLGAVYHDPRSSHPGRSAARWVRALCGRRQCGGV